VGLLRELDGCDAGIEVVIMIADYSMNTGGAGYNKNIAALALQLLLKVKSAPSYTRAMIASLCKTD
jgi:hypothetical protein